MKRIDKDNKIFNSEEYLKDKYMFYIIEKNFPSPDLMLYSDEDNYVICRGKEGLPTWIWTKDNIEKDKVLEIEKLLQNYLTDNEIDRFTCKKELYDYLKDDFPYINKDSYFEMGFLTCEKLKNPRNVSGKMDIPRDDEKDLLTEYLYLFHKEINDGDPISYEEAKELIGEKYKDNSLRVWRDSRDKIVCMASFNIIDNMVSLGSAYVPEEERNKGYAANLVHDLTGYLLDKGLVPLLYTDYNYPPSNTSYKNAGYEEKGVLVNFTCSKVKKLNR